MSERFKTNNKSLKWLNNATHIITDSQTGVQYLMVAFSGGVSLTPLIDLDGKPIPADKE